MRSANQNPKNTARWVFEPESQGNIRSQRLGRNWAISEHMTLNGSDYVPEQVPAMLRKMLAKGTRFGWDFVNVAAATGAKFALYNDDWSPKPLMAEVDDQWQEWLGEITNRTADTVRSSGPAME